MTDTEKYVFEILAKRDLVRSRTLFDELKGLLLRTKGKITYLALANGLNNIVSESTVRRFLISQDGFMVRKDRLLPSLDSAAKLRRVEWAETFWIFWKSVRAIPSQKVKFVMVHMDEKWFYAVVTRSNCKVLTSIGLDPCDYYVHHKNHITKEMYIVVTAFVLNNNNITGGGKGFQLHV